MPGYKQNANKLNFLHSLVWKFCPKEVFRGKNGVETACALAVCCFNDGAISLAFISRCLGLETTPLSEYFLLDKDISEIQKSKYKSSEDGKKLRRLSRQKRKGLDDEVQQSEGVMYAHGAFAADAPGPSKTTKH